MAVTITAANLSTAIRLGSSTEETEQATRLLEYAKSAVLAHAPEAPDSAHNEAVIRLAGYLFDQPNAARGPGYARALQNSGAAAILLPYRIVRAGSTATALAIAAVSGSLGNPVIGLAIAGDMLTVTYADGSTVELTLPDSGGGGADQTARDAAAAAQSSATAAQSRADSAFDAAGQAQSQANAAASASFAIERVTIRFDGRIAANLTTQTEAISGIPGGYTEITALYPSGHSRATIQARLKSGTLNTFAGDLEGGPVAEFDADTLLCHTAHAQIDFLATGVRLQILGTVLPGTGTESLFDLRLGMIGG